MQIQAISNAISSIGSVLKKIDISYEDSYQYPFDEYYPEYSKDIDTSFYIDKFERQK